MEVNESMFWGNHMNYVEWHLLLNGLLWLGLILLGIWLLARLFPNTDSGRGRRTDVAGRQGLAQPAADTALQILQKRYACGELTKEEYENIRRSLAL